MAVDVSTATARCAVIGAEVMYHGSLTHHHGPAVVVETCGNGRELWHVSPESITLAGGPPQ